MFGESPSNVTVFPAPFNVNPPGVDVIVQFPAGNPLKSTLAVGFRHEG